MWHVGHYPNVIRILEADEQEIGTEKLFGEMQTFVDSNSADSKKVQTKECLDPAL
jgi:hypothetical protein